jgi:predicted transcriptional regulator
MTVKTRVKQTSRRLYRKSEGIMYRSPRSDFLYRANTKIFQMKYRSRTEIVSNILIAANGGATKTKIMYKAFLSYAQLKEYLTVLLQNGLLEYEDESTSFKTTSKGIKFLAIYDQLDVLSPSPTSPATISVRR